MSNFQFPMTNSHSNILHQSNGHRSSTGCKSASTVHRATLAPGEEGAVQEPIGSTDIVTTGFNPSKKNVTEMRAVGSVHEGINIGRAYGTLSKRKLYSRTKVRATR